MAEEADDEEEEEEEERARAAQTQPSRAAPRKSSGGYRAARARAAGGAESGRRTTLSADAMQERAALESVLGDFGVRGEIINARPGPVVTLYELEPAPGIKSSRVIGLSDDIARSMSALSARVAVVPGAMRSASSCPIRARDGLFARTARPERLRGTARSSRSASARPSAASR